jgi:hypothetical protein
VRQMGEYGHWKRKRGCAKSKSFEPLWLCYKGKRPQNMPLKRSYCDQGSPLFYEILQKVPVLAPKLQTFVATAVRQDSLQRMVGIPENEDPTEMEEAEHEQDEHALDQLDSELPQPTKVAVDGASTTASVNVARPKRKLYRQHSYEEVPWFPHDNAIELLKELCWEAGKPRWVIHGTPAAGAGVHGCLEMGCSVVALCHDEHHRQNFMKACVERAVEEMVCGKSVAFQDPTLQARSAELNLTKAAKEASKPGDKAVKVNGAPPLSTTKTKKAKPPKKKVCKESENAEESEDASDDEESESAEQTPKKPRTVTKKAPASGKDI